KPDERPVAGPVMPLTRTPPSGTEDGLLGAAKSARSPADAGLLGGPAAPARGRADDFSWPRAEAPGAAQENPDRAEEKNVGRAQSGDVVPGSGKRPRGA